MPEGLEQKSIRFAERCRYLDRHAPFHSLSYIHPRPNTITFYFTGRSPRTPPVGAKFGTTRYFFFYRTLEESVFL